MKTFNDFLSEITPEVFESIKADIEASREPSSITDAVPEISFKMALKLIERYHKWLHD